MRIAAGGCLFQRIRRKLGIDVAGVAVGRDVEAGRFGKAQSNGRGGVSNLDGFLGRKRKAHFDVAVAIVQFHFAAGIFDGNVVGIRAQVEIAGRVGDFDVSGASFHVAGELREREIGTLGDEAHAFGNFVGADGTKEFSVNGQPACR